MIPTPAIRKGLLSHFPPTHIGLRSRASRLFTPVCFLLRRPAAPTVSRLWVLGYSSAVPKPSTFHQGAGSGYAGPLSMRSDVRPISVTASPPKDSLSGKRTTTIHPAIPSGSLNVAKRKNLSLRQLREIERLAVSRLRHCLQASDGFEGLEEPPLPLHPFAQADLAVRPTGCTEDLWLPVQVKSTSRQLCTRVRAGGRPSPLWYFQNVCGYGGMPVVCIFVPQGSPSALTERAWLFPGERFNRLKRPGWLGITHGGKYDTTENRCSLTLDRQDDSHVGDRLLVIWKQAHSCQSLYKLQDLQTLQTQLSPTHLAEWTMTQKCRWLFDRVHGGMQIRDAPCPTLPHDIELRLSTWTRSEWVRLQLKSAYAVQKSRNGLGHVSTKKKLLRGSVPYNERDFDFLLVSPPQNETGAAIDRSSSLPGNEQEDRWRFFYLIPTRELVREGIVSSPKNAQKGLQTITLDFSTKAAEQCRGRPSRLHRWKIDTFDLPLAGKQIAEVLSFERGREAGSVPFTKENRQLLEASMPSTVAKHSSSIPASGQIRKLTTIPSQGQIPSNTQTVEKRSHHSWEIERTAVSLLRASLRAAEGFRGLEEPSVPLPPFARADLAVRPVGCSEDLWLPVQARKRLTPQVLPTYLRALTPNRCRENKQI
uniref:Uncharacterized protein n=1 Tax=Chromera velia CCMP2878 TaxID=1169474 RepID=A0A0G4FJY2_9ALVE|eukprot:Cvel_3430.t1-p1 / transcript=Cvel_3430.t1 / gene=Cvel_3430 / organism=Chromera_velia_CCMP2878 / gene_product=hypothetical protein / transcript_product=hypothetical protein / location=Cvel_scaffold138:34557-39283(-) / protein_length=648 / sequence_SO=supercontig / SO=protein_coding / is_pseudo=false